MRDAHKILNVSRTASVKDIKAAYRRLALKLHPDTNGGDEVKSEQFKKVNAAYSYLTDPKADYDEEYDDFSGFSYSYSPGPKYKHSSRPHWNPFQSPFQNMKSDHRRNKNYNTNSSTVFEEWEDFAFVDFESGEEIIFGFDKNGKARTSRKQSQYSDKKVKNNKKNHNRNENDFFDEITVDDIDDIISNSSSPGWESFSSSNKNSSKSKNDSFGGTGKKFNGKGREKNGKKKKSGKSRRNRRGDDDCTIS